MPRDEPLIVGRLQAHGSAPYQYRTGENPSYYLKVMTDRGERTLWGQDLKRAIEQATTRPAIGDLVGARRVSREPVRIPARPRDSQGRDPRQGVQPAYRNRWV